MAFSPHQRAWTAGLGFKHFLVEKNEAGSPERGIFEKANLQLFPYR